MTEGKEVFVIDDLSTGALANLAGVLGNPQFHFMQASVLDGTGAGGAGRARGFHLSPRGSGRRGVGREKPGIHDRGQRARTENVLAAAGAAWGGRVADVHVGGVWQERPGPVPGRRRSGNWSPTFGRWSYACSKFA